MVTGKCGWDGWLEKPGVRGGHMLQKRQLSYEDCRGPGFALLSESNLGPEI